MVTLVNQTKNKIYKMDEPKPGDISFRVLYGRVGGSEIVKSMPVERWNEIYKEKLENGYVDQSDLYKGTREEPKKEYLVNNDVELTRVLNLLRKKSRQIVSQTFICTKPTEAMLNRAEEILAKLSVTTDLWEFNESLMELFSLIPRRMKNIITNTAKSTEDFAKIIERETTLIDNLSVYDRSDMELDTDGLKFEKCSSKDWETINRMFYGAGHKIKNAWKVSSADEDKRFENYLSQTHTNDTKLVFHGSRTENWWSILLKALSVRPSNAISTGNMFGFGLYFANDAIKSIGYTSLRDSKWTGGQDTSGYMGIYEIAYNNPWHIFEWHNDYLDITERDVKQRGCGCVHAHKGRDLCFDEVIVYNRDACRIRYLLEVQ